MRVPLRLEVDYLGLSACHSERSVASLLMDLGRYDPYCWWSHRPDTMGRDVVTRLQEERPYRQKMKELVKDTRRELHEELRAMRLSSNG